MATISQAAEFLNVSIEYVTELLENGELHYKNISTGAFIFDSHLKEYKLEMIEKYNKSMNELVELTEEMGLYD